MLIAAMHHAFRGLHVNQERLARHADRISRWGTLDPVTAASAGDITQEVVGLKIAARGYEANLAVMRTTNSLLGTFIDILA